MTDYAPLMVAMLLLALMVALPACATTFYIAPGGNDAWSGKLVKPNSSASDGPVATLAGAQAKLRALKAAGPLSEPVDIVLLPGEYPITEPLVLNFEDSGTRACPVTFRAQQPGTALINGGKRITGFEPAGEGLWVAELPEVAAGEWYFRQLFVDGQRRQRARTPNPMPWGKLIQSEEDRAFLHMAAPGPDARKQFFYRTGDLAPFEHQEDVEIIVYYAWEINRFRIAALDEADQLVSLTGSAVWPFGQWDATMRYHVENTLGALDQPGEWFLDRHEGKLYYMPLPGEKPDSIEAIAPVVTSFVQLEGDPEAGLPVQFVNLEGLAFSYSDWPMAPEGHFDGQAAYSVEAVISANGASRCSITNCEISHIGTYGIWLKRGCRENRIEQNHLFDLGAGGLRIGWGGPELSRGFQTSHNTVHNNYLHEGGRIYPGAVGIWLGHTPYNTLSHNEIADFYYTGFSIGWRWGYAESGSHHNIIEYNNVHHLGQGVLSDMGGIYLLGPAPGTTVRNNVFHDIYSYSYGGWGIYPDEGSSELLIENNLVYRTKSAGFHQHYGKDNVVRNNIFAYGIEYQLMRTREEPHISFMQDHNIVLAANASPILGSNWNDGHFKLDENLYYNESGSDLFYQNKSFEEWRTETGQDEHSRWADPQFVNPRALDFRLKPSSPALEMGFVEFDYTQAGLVGDKRWTNLAHQVRQARMGMAAQGGGRVERLRGQLRGLSCRRKTSRPDLL